MKNQSKLIKYVIKHIIFVEKYCRLLQKPYLCNVFFMVLDLRLIKVGVKRYPFFFALLRTLHLTAIELPAHF
jgi:hypothetical protein